VSAAAYPGTFHITAGEDALRAWKPGDGFDKWFCGECGSAVFARNPNKPEQVAIRMGTFDGDPGVRPIARQFVKYAAAWEPIPDDGLPRFEERRTPM
jgi:hypothetical protein